MASSGPPVTCGRCGLQVDEPPLTWSVESGPRGTSWTCETCTRTHVRSMEAGLEQELW